MQARFKFVSAVLLGFVLIAAAACGGSDGLSTAEEEALQERLEAAEREAAEAEREAAEAEQRRQAAEQARKEAEEEAAAAERAEREAEEQRQAAQEAAQEAEAERQAAEAARQRLEAEAEARRRADATERARVAITGTRTLGTAPTVGSIEFGEPVPLTNPMPPFTTTTSRSGRWSITGHADVREATHHTIEIYTDVEAPTREAFRTSDYNTDNDASTAVIDGTGMVVGHVDIENATGGDDRHSRVAASGSFPREIGNPVPFSLVDRGLDQVAFEGKTFADPNAPTDDELAADPPITRAQYNQYRAGNFRDTDDFPQRYAYTTSGTLQGAGGTYRCDADAATGTCTVQNRGGSFQFVGDWDFIPSSGTVQIVVPDGQYMWFGWWAQRTVEHSETTPEHTTDIWAFQANHGGNRVTTSLADATGSATYTGPAAGHYAVYEPDTGDSGIGSFTASATLQADFDTDTVSGTITNFSNDSSWSLGLKQKGITGGATAAIVDGEDTVTWTIDGIPDDSGTWEAAFYSNLPITGGTVDYQPHGIAGTFQAAYDPSGAGPRAAVIGGFGAHR